MSSALRMSAVCCIVSQSDFEPIMRPTSGCGGGFIALARYFRRDRDRRLDVALTLELGEQLVDAREAAPVVRSDSARYQSGDVSARRVTRVMVPGVRRIF